MARYGIVVYWPDAAAADEQVLLHAVALLSDFQAELRESRAALDTAPSAQTVFSIRLNGVEKATVTFNAASLTGVFTCAETWRANPGDRIEIVAPSTPDATAAGFAISLIGEQVEENNLYAKLVGESKLSATMERSFLYAFLSSESSIASRLRERNAFGPQLLESVSGLQGTLSDCKTLKSRMPSRKGSEFFGRLTVIHSKELFK